MISASLSLVQKLQRKWIDLQISPYSEIEGFLSPNEASALFEFASRLPANSTIVEIGSWKGKSTYCLARGLKQGRVIAIDAFDASGDTGSVEAYEKLKGELPLVSQFRERMRHLGVLEKIEIYQGFSHEFVGDISDIYLLFIDGDHSKEGCEFDYLNYAPYLVSGGYILFHDYYADRKELGPTWVIENQVLPSNEFKFIKLVDSLWIAQKY
jgi:MMP 1-O-methyltransferase